MDTANSANTETLTPSSVLINASQCNISGTFANAHSAGAYFIRSGTCGLKEAFNDLGASGTALVTQDGRIAELEVERKMLWDKICLLGIGAPAFASTPQDQPNEKTDAEKKPAGGAAVVAAMRPSAIMRRMDRLAEARWLRKHYPSRVSENPTFTAKDAKD